MKPPLERTAILSKDIAEFDPSLPFIVMLPEANIVLAADRVEHYDDKGVVKVIIGERVIATFSSAFTWVCVARDMVDLVTRETQLRREVDNARTEKALMTELMPEAAELVNKLKEQLDTEDGKEKMPRSPGWGQYL